MSSMTIVSQKLMIPFLLIRNTANAPSLSTAVLNAVISLSNLSGLIAIVS